MIMNKQPTTNFKSAREVTKEDINLKYPHPLPINANIKELKRKDCNLEFHNKMFFPSDENLFREYQFNIVKACLLTNTLVCLPTGLGKTFIASTTIYNFHLWFEGKIFFLAPTKPLVNQQKSAFLKMFPDLIELVSEVNGSISQKKREKIYQENKIFFMTPQTLDNDISKNMLDCNTISLLIFDEAHRAQKKFAYTNIVTKSIEKAPHNFFRIIALSASPGSNTESIQGVIDNLKIKNVELRTENDKDIKPYIFNKEIKIFEVESTNDILKYKNMICNLISARLDILKKFKVVDQSLNIKYLGVGQLLKYQENFKLKKMEFENEIGQLMINEIYQTFSLLFQLLHSKKMLETQGLDSFKESIKKLDICIPNVEEKKIQKLKSEKKFITPAKKFVPPHSAAKKNLVESADFKKLKFELFDTGSKQAALSFGLNTSQKFEDKNSNNFSTDNKPQHPKLLKLKELMRDYHKNIKNNSKVIVFTQFKDTAREITSYLQQSGEFCDISFSIFTGQDKHFKQKDQLEILKKFRDGEIRVLIATSVAEEGLDVGDVDLIICYDIASTSPIKMIQRFGRTGRKRNGLVIVLAAKGEEKSKYYRSLYRLKGINKELKALKYNFENSKIKFSKGEDNILIIPDSFINTVEYFEMEKDVVEDTEEILSDEEDSNKDELEDEEILNDESDLDVLYEFNNKNNNFNEITNDNYDEVELIMNKADSFKIQNVTAKKLNTATDDIYSQKKQNSFVKNTNIKFNNNNLFTNVKTEIKLKDALNNNPFSNCNKINLNNNNTDYNKVFETPTQNLKQAFNFKIFNKKTNSGNKYSTTKNENQSESKDIVIATNYAIGSCQAQNVLIKKVNLCEDSPIRLLDVDLDEILENKQSIIDLDFDINEILENKQSIIEEIQKLSDTKKHKEENRYSNFTIVEDFIKKLESDEELLNELFNFKEEKENDERINSSNLERQLFKVLENENGINIRNVNFKTNTDHPQEFKIIADSNDNYWCDFSSENKKRKFSFFNNESSTKQILEGEGFSTKKFKSFN